MTPYCQCFGESGLLHLEVDIMLKIETVRFSEKSANQPPQHIHHTKVETLYVRADWPALLLCIWEVLASNLGLEALYPD
jgi:hypothetical protein